MTLISTLCPQSLQVGKGRVFREIKPNNEKGATSHTQPARKLEIAKRKQEAEQNCAPGIQRSVKEGTGETGMRFREGVWQGKIGSGGTGTAIPEVSPNCLHFPRFFSFVPLPNPAESGKMTTGATTTRTSGHLETRKLRLE